MSNYKIKFLLANSILIKKYATNPAKLSCFFAALFLIVDFASEQFADLGLGKRVSELKILWHFIGDEVLAATI